MYFLKVYLFVKREVFGKRCCLKNCIVVCLKNSIVFSACLIAFGADGVNLLCAVVGRGPIR